MREPGIDAGGLSAEFFSYLLEYYKLLLDTDNWNEEDYEDDFFAAGHFFALAMKCCKLTRFVDGLNVLDVLRVSKHCSFFSLFWGNIWTKFNSYSSFVTKESVLSSPKGSSHQRCLPEC